MGQFQIDISDTKRYPMGLSVTDGGVHIAVAAAAKECSLILFLRKAPGGGQKSGGESEVRLPFPREGRHGIVWEMTVKGEGLELCDYAFEADGKRFPDPCGRSFHGREQWGRISQPRRLLTTPVAEPEFDWEGDAPLSIPYEDSIVYRAHVRGLTKHSSSGVEHRGTFRGVVEKIPYLKELGITTLELLPSAEFDEVMMAEHTELGPYAVDEPTGRLNYWGYTAACICAPKASYAGKGLCPVTEFKNMVKELHRAGIELVTELYFTGNESPAFVLDAVRFWVREFHVDGVHLSGFAPTALLAADPYLADTKLWASSWDAGMIGAEQPVNGKRRLGEYNDGFLIDMRRALKGDEGQMSNLVNRNRRSPAAFGVLNYLAGTNGFTMMDMVSYDRKHNEENGEDNRDGSDCNFSWNCGAEGPVRKKKVAQMRKRQLRNAFLLLFLSQGTPLILAGDEFGNSQGGNNNAYCQDNDISWINWKLKETNRDLFEFVRYVIAFRKAHPVFHMPSEPRLMDYLACGCPDMSYHGVGAWQPEFESFRRQIAILYCGEYGCRPDGTADDYFFVTYNMHWEPHEFALPNLPRGRSWKLAFDTGDDASNGYYEPGREREVADQKKHMVPPRSVLVFVGKPQQETGVNPGVREDGEQLQKKFYIRRPT